MLPNRADSPGAASSPVSGQDFKINVRSSDGLQTYLVLVVAIEEFTC